MRKARQFRPRLILGTLLSLALAVVIGLAAFRAAEARIADMLDRSLILTRRAIEAEVERYQYLPRLTLEDPRVRAAIRTPDDAIKIAEVNRYLAEAARLAGAADLLLFDAGGTALAASNWNGPGSSIGKEYGFRPYFRDAMATGEGRFYGIGVTTGEPGYFLSKRLDLPTGEVAVMAVKIDLLPLQTAWRDAGAFTALADATGVVFLSGEPAWLYRPLFPLSDAARNSLKSTRAYNGENPGARAPILDAAAVDASRPRVTMGERRLLLRRSDIAGEGWTLVSAAALAPAIASGWIAAGVTALVALAATAVGQTLAQRRRLVRMRLRQGDLLERRVEARTRELAREIEVRARAERELRAAQDALVHAAKMAALGRMSAAIVHEISQPLAAMEVSLAATIISGQIKDAPSEQRIERARGHVRRMQRTIKHLKTFSRKDPAEILPVCVDEAIRNAIDLVALRAGSVPIRTVVIPQGSTARILADKLRLEQVLVNLLLNALDALAGCQDPCLVVERQVAEGRVFATVIDNGSGIPEPLLDRVTEPFFSTKASGEGLGLGLSITRTIVEEFGGRLDIASRPGEETRVTVSFPEVADRALAAE